MNCFDVPEKFAFQFKLFPYEKDLFLFQMKYENSVILCKIKNGQMSLSLKKDNNEEEIKLDCYLKNMSYHDMVLNINSKINLEINNKFVYSIGSLGHNFKKWKIYFPINGTQKYLNMKKFEKIS